jgi:SAM-dependent methyltransferase
VSESALDSWREQLESWAIPADILDQAVESPWVLPHSVFVRRTARRVASPGGPSLDALTAALRAVPGGRGSVLDVGAGAGAASLPAASMIREVTAVDADERMLAEFAATSLELGVPAGVVAGRWPHVSAPVADVVVCGHVLYNEADLRPFVSALSAHAQRRVIAEITALHPLTGLNPLWLRFHGLERPEGPTADDAVAALHECGIVPEVTRWSRPAESEYGSFEEVVEVTRRRLCLPPAATSEVAQALIESGVTPSAPPDLGSSGRHLVTLVWDGTAAP